jgi:hypothetical protein
VHYLLCTYYKYSYVGLCSKWRKIWESLADFGNGQRWTRGKIMRSRELSCSAGSVRLPLFAMHWGCFAKRHFLILYFLVIAQWLTFPKSDNGSRQNPNTNTWQAFWDLHLGGVPYTSSISIKLCINQGHCCRRFTGSPESSLANRFSNQDGMPYPKSPQRTPPSPDSQGRTVWNVRGFPFSCREDGYRYHHQYLSIGAFW